MVGPLFLGWVGFLFEGGSEEEVSGKKRREREREEEVGEEKEKERSSIRRAKSLAKEPECIPNGGRFSPCCAPLSSLAIP
jgi:hypothetical protein